MPIEVIEDCQIEWDKNRGVLYVHNRETGMTVIRICGLKKRKCGIFKRRLYRYNASITCELSS